MVDECGDTMVMSHYSVILAYMFVFDNKYLEMFWFMMNVSFYCMEIKFKLCGNLVMIMGELSIVEIELILSTLLCLFGYYGHDHLQQTLDIGDDSYFASIAGYRIGFLIGILMNMM